MWSNLWCCCSCPCFSLIILKWNHKNILLEFWSASRRQWTEWKPERTWSVGNFLYASVIHSLIIMAKWLSVLLYSSIDGSWMPFTVFVCDKASWFWCVLCICVRKLAAVAGKNTVYCVCARRKKVYCLMYVCVRKLFAGCSLPLSCVQRICTMNLVGLNG